MTLELQNFSLTLPGGAQVLRDVWLRVGAGECVGLVGESGSGKSLLALSIIGLLPDGARSTGAIRLDGTDLLGLAEAQRERIRGARIGMVFQEPASALDPLMRLDDLVGQSLRRHRGLGRAAARALAAQMLARVGLDRPAAYPHQVSGGQRQRAMIAAAVIAGPALLLADEPTTALDSVTQAEILDLLRGVSGERGMAMLLVSHDLAVIARRTERVAVLYAGSVVERGRTDLVFARLAHPYTRALLAASPRLARGLPTPIPGVLPDPRALPPGCVFAPRCPRASDRCQEPPLLEGDADHAVACWHPWR